MIDFDPITKLDRQHTIAGLTVSHATRTRNKGKHWETGKVNYYIYSSNSRSLSTGQCVAISSELVNRASITGNTWRTASAGMPGKFGALEDRVHRTPTKEGFCFGNTAGVF